MEIVEQQGAHNIISSLEEVKDDSVTPRNVQMKIDEIITLLKENDGDALVNNRIMDELDQLTVDHNLESFTRTQIYNIISLLETF